jgi:N-acetylmuramoyl-L-alanine amidase
MRGNWGWAVLLLSAAAPAQELREVRIWDGPEGTRVVLDLDAASPFELQTLENPQRVVIDLAGVKRATDIGSAQDGRGLVQRVRTAEHGEKLRVVLDVSGPITAKAFALDPNSEYRYRVVIDLAAPVETVLASSETPVTETPPSDPIAEIAARTTPAPSMPTASAPAAVAPAATAPAESPPPPPLVRTRPTIIAIDAGHGGEDPGAKGRLGTQEKDIALSIARHLARMTDQQPGYKAVLIRDGDYFIPLRGRINKARAAQADLFVSIHCNASPNREAAGSAVYALSPRGATNEHARWLANKENASDLIGGIELQDKDDTLAAVLFDISQTSAMEASLDVGGRVLGALSQVNNVIRPDVQQAGFVVLKSPDIPSILVETAFISNAGEERELSNPEYQAKMAASILDGIKGYFESYRPKAAEITADSGARPELVDVSLRKPARKTRRKK